MGVKHGIIKSFQWVPWKAVFGIIRPVSKEMDEMMYVIGDTGSFAVCEAIHSSGDSHHPALFSFLASLSGGKAWPT
jgi:hypothetical protein